MARRETRQYKALYFDLRIHDLKEFYLKKNHLSGYAYIKNYLLKHDFIHEQWSGCHSAKKMTDLEIFDLVQETAAQMPWFSKCINHFAVTNIGANYNLLDVLDPMEFAPVPELKPASTTE